jgi:allantoin racemase
MASLRQANRAEEYSPSGKEKRMKRICVFAPIIESESYLNDKLNEQLAIYNIPGVISVEARCLTTGPSSIENEIDNALSVPDLLTRALAVEKHGFDGVIVACMCDPGVGALREALSIPVLGTAESTFHIAAMLGSRFGVLDVTDDARVAVRNLVAVYGLRDKFASFRSINIPPEQLCADAAKTNAALAAQARLAVLEDQADILVLNCTGMLGCAQSVAASLAADGFHVPVIDPMPITIRLMSGLVQEGLCHSKRAWPTPHKNKSIRGYNLPQFYDVIK